MTALTHRSDRKKTVKTQVNERVQRRESNLKQRIDDKKAKKMGVKVKVGPEYIYIYILCIPSISRNFILRMNTDGFSQNQRSELASRAEAVRARRRTKPRNSDYFIIIFWIFVFSRGLHKT